jgi:hypothetical protein
MAINLAYDVALEAAHYLAPERVNDFETVAFGL